MQKYAFVDRDGTIIWEPERPAGIDPRETFPLASADQVQFMDGAIEGLKKLTDKGYGLVLVTNQTFLGTPKHPKDIFDQVMNRMREGLKANGLHFEFEMVCPHGPDEGCDCRKPAIGGLKDFLASHPADLANSLMFGDRDTDGEFAKNLGVRFVKIETNKRFDLPIERQIPDRKKPKGSVGIIMRNSSGKISNSRFRNLDTAIDAENSSLISKNNTFENGAPIETSSSLLDKFFWPLIVTIVTSLAVAPIIYFFGWN